MASKCLSARASANYETDFATRTQTQQLNERAFCWGAFSSYYKVYSYVIASDQVSSLPGLIKQLSDRGREREDTMLARENREFNLLL